jgi:hypothetical protein
MQGSVSLRLSKCGLLEIVEVVEDRSHHSPAFFAPPADPEPGPKSLKPRRPRPFATPCASTSRTSRATRGSKRPIRSARPGTSRSGRGQRLREWAADRAPEPVEWDTADPFCIWLSLGGRQMAKVPNLRHYYRQAVARPQTCRSGRKLAHVASRLVNHRQVSPRRTVNQDELQSYA